MRRHDDTMGQDFWDGSRGGEPQFAQITQIPKGLKFVGFSSRYGKSRSAWEAVRIWVGRVLTADHSDGRGLGSFFWGIPNLRQVTPTTPFFLHTEGRGASPYGASTVAGAKGELAPKPEDLQLAEALGRGVAEITLKVRGEKR